MHKRYNANRIKAMREKAQRMARARWDAENARSKAKAPARERELAIIEAENLPRRQDDAVGVLQWTDLATGQVRRWTLRIGDRKDRFTCMFHADGKTTGNHGLSWLFDQIRSKILGSK